MQQTTDVTLSCIAINQSEPAIPLLCLAQTIQDFEAVSEIWREVYCEELGWLTPKDCDPSDDAYHAASKYILARDSSGVPVGAMRVVHYGTRGLPIEQFVDLTEIKSRCSNQVIECARLMVPQRCRDLRTESYQFGIYAAMVKATLHYCMQEGIYDVLANCFKYTETTPIKSLQQFGFVDLGLEFMDDLNEASPCTALHLNIKTMLARMYSDKRKLNRYMISHDDSFDIYCHNNNKKK
ncbi:MAG: hypothetical protein ACOH2K_15785 [Burkholderiaceae bacterium]